MKNKKWIYSFFAITALSSPLLHAEIEEITQEQTAPTYDIAVVSESLGHLLGKNISSIGSDFDIDQIVKGLKDYREGKEAPLNDMECISAITAIQEKAFKDLGEKNLQAANEYMQKQKENKNIHMLEEGKLHYQIDKAGEGAVVEEHSAPLIRYKGTLLDNTTFGESQSEERIALDETIEGISRSLVGMKEGEKRTIYIHPELGYGMSDALPPQSLLTFEVEVVKANVPEDEAQSEDAIDEHLTMESFDLSDELAETDEDTL